MPKLHGNNDAMRVDRIMDEKSIGYRDIIDELQEEKIAKSKECTR
jgi:hypothetical protein